MTGFKKNSFLFSLGTESNQCLTLFSHDAHVGCTNSQVLPRSELTASLCHPPAPQVNGESSDENKFWGSTEN